MRERLADPSDPQTFRRCILDFAERERHTQMLDFHRDLLRLRREHAAFRAQRRRGVDGAVLGEQAFVLRYFDDEGDRLVLVNLGRDLHLVPAPEPLLAPPEGMRWETLWSSDDTRYGACGTPLIESEEDGWHLPGESAVVMYPLPRIE